MDGATLITDRFELLAFGVKIGRPDGRQRVEQVLLIHRPTGLKLEHCFAPTVAYQDPEMVSGMLTAIQDFVRDSFSAPPGETLDSLRVGDLEVWVEQGPHATIAAVIRGHAPASLRSTSGVAASDSSQSRNAAILPRPALCSGQAK